MSVVVPLTHLRRVAINHTSNLRICALETRSEAVAAALPSKSMFPLWH